MGNAHLDRRHALRAGWTRVVLGALGLLPGTLLLPELEPQRSLLATYLFVAFVQQLLIWKNIGGELRAIAGGIFDIVVLTLLVHRLGSLSTLLIGLYVVLGMVEALVHSRRVALVLAAIASVCYAGSLFLEAFHVIPYAPNASRWAAPVPPDLKMAFLATLLITVLLFVSTGLVSDLVTRIRERESELTEANAQLAELSLRDPLTQLYNRRHLMACLEREVARSRRGHRLALLMIDLDGFKQVNDQHGHLRGDEVLMQIAHALEKTTRFSDVAGRYGGDEFAVVLPDTDTEQAQRVAERLVESIREVGGRLQNGGRVTASVGIAVASPDDDALALQRRADEATYRAKQRGGDRVA